ncbi:MAG: hypothetical protein RSD95_08115 [Clostridia bacterium]
MPKRKEADAPWEQQPRESAKAFQAFAAYRDMGSSRTVRKVVQQLNKSLTLIGKWSSAYDWVERSRAYDRELDRQAREQAVRDVQQMTNRHIRIAMQLQHKALEALETLDVKALSPKMQLAFLAKATELERLNRLGAAGMDETGQKESAPEVEIVIEGEDGADD